MGKRQKLPMDVESHSGRAGPPDDTSPDKARRRKRRTRSSINARKTEDNNIIRMLAQLNDQMRKQSESNSEIRKQMGNLIESQNGQSKEMEKLIESQNGQSKVLEKLIESQNGQSKELEKLIESQNGQSKELEKLTASIRKQLEFHTNITGHAESDAPRSQMNHVQSPRYQLVFRSASISKIIQTGQLIEISVALVQGNSDRPVENGPLASATVELVVVSAKFNENDNQYDWSREDFECKIVKPRCGNSAKGDVDQSVKSIVTNGRFNLVQGVRGYSGSTIFQNSSNSKVRLGVMVVSPTQERVLEGLSESFMVRDCVRSEKQSKSRDNRSNGQRQALGDNDYQEDNSSMPNLQQPSWPNSTQTGGIRSNIIGGQSQLPFLGTSNMLSTEPTSQEQHYSIQQNQSPHVPMVAQATYNQNDELASPSNYLVRDSNFMVNDHVLGHAIDMQFPTIMPLQLVWDRPNVGPIKRDWNLLDQLMPLKKFNNCGLPSKRLMQEHLFSWTIMSKEVMQARRNVGVIIEPLEPDDSDEEHQLKRKMHSKYQLRFENKVCEGYHIMDPIKADDGNLLKVGLFYGNRKIINGPLSSAPVQIIVLHGDFNDHGQDYWTSEEFNCYEVCARPGEEASSVLGGDCILVLSEGEVCLGDAFFQMSSYCARTGKFKMGVRLASAQEERIQEGVSEPFWVKDRHCAGKCGFSIGPEDDSARINHPSVMQVTMDGSDLNGEENIGLTGNDPHFAPLVALKNFSLSELKDAINGGNILGEGGSFKVYKGVLMDGKVVAIKTFKRSRELCWERIYYQLLLASKLQHQNIVKVLGYGHDEVETQKTSVIMRLLKHKNRPAKERDYFWVEEYVPNGTLYMKSRESLLDWPSVTRILEQVAQGIHYLHEQHVIHGDLKPSNILLDSDMNPKIIDFLSMVLNVDEITEDDILGTLGYMAPEYASSGIVSMKSDIYAFGVILLETVRRSMCRSKPPEGHFFDVYEWARRAWEAALTEELFDPSLFDGSQGMEIRRWVQVGLLCIQDDREDRPTIADVLEMLNGKEELPSPMQACNQMKRNHQMKGKQMKSDLPVQTGR